jgi:hypothetical protein
MQEFYEVFPEIPAYLRESFEETPEELVASANNPGDSEVLLTVFGNFQKEMS